MIYLATVYSHFGAIRYKRACEAAGIPAVLMPVPRSLSSSCGTCVRCEERWLRPEGESAQDVEQVAAWDGKSYTAVYHIDETEG